MEEGVQNRQKTGQRQDLDLELGGCRLYVREGGVISKGLGSARLPGEPSLHPGNIPGELPGVAESRTSEHAHQPALAVLGKKPIPRQQQWVTT